MSILDSLNRFMSGVGCVLCGETATEHDLRNRVYTLEERLSAKDAEIAALSEKLDEQTRLAETRLDRINRAFEINPDEPEIPQVVKYLQMCAEGAKDSDTEQGQINALMFDRAAVALESDPYSECFTAAFKIWYAGNLAADTPKPFKMPVPPIVPPRTNGGRLRAMSNIELAAFLADVGKWDGTGWLDWLGSGADSR